MWSLAVYAGVCHGELVSLAWEDIVQKAGTMMIRRNHTLTKEFTLPKTEAGTDRIINLIQPAIDVLKSQAELTRLGKQYQLAAGANPNFIAKQMGHTDAQMVYRVYGSWMAENNQDQVLILNQKLSEFAPSMPHAVGSDDY